MPSIQPVVKGARKRFRTSSSGAEGSASRSPLHPSSKGIETLASGSATFSPSSSAISAQAPRDASPHHAQLPKQLRLLIRAFLMIQSRLEAEHALLSKLWYKGRSQFRSATWWKHIDGLRRCLLRLVGHSLTASATPSSLNGSQDGQLQSTLDTLLAALSALFNAAPPSSGCRTVPKFTSPPMRLDRSGETAPPVSLFTRAAQEVYVLAQLLHETRKRARTAYRVASIHLRTPPAPTFAPQAVVLMTLAASVERIATDGVLGVEGEEPPSQHQLQQQPSGARSIHNLTGLYTLLRSVVVDAVSATEEPREEGQGKRRRPTASAETGEIPTSAVVEPLLPPKKRNSRSRTKQAVTTAARPAAADGNSGHGTPADEVAASSRNGSKRQKVHLPETIPDPIPMRRPRIAFGPNATPRPTSSGTATPESFAEASQSFDAKRAIKSAKRFFGRPAATGPEDVATTAASTVSQFGPLKGAQGAPLLSGHHDDEGDDLGEAIAR